jgi:putative intracellular protease/amidase
MTRVLFALTSHFKDDKGWESGCYVLEVAVPYFFLEKHGVEIDFVSPKGGSVPVKQCDLDDPKVKSFFKDKDARYKFENSLLPEKVDAKQYDAIYFPGGHGVMYDLPYDKKISALAQNIYERGGVVCAVCHGGAGLLNIQLSDGEKLIKGKKLTAFSNSEEEALGTDVNMPFLLETALCESGAIYSSAANWQSHVVVDGRLITGQNPASDLDMAKELWKQLKNK